MKELFDPESLANDQEFIGTGRYCSFCNSEEGLPRPIGNYVVNLESYDTKSNDNRLACQCCRRKRPRYFKKNEVCEGKKASRSKKKKFSINLFSFF